MFYVIMSRLLFVLTDVDGYRYIIENSRPCWITKQTMRLPLQR